MLRTVVVALSIYLAACQTSLAALWELPPGVKTITVNGYPMAYSESGTGEPVVLVHGGGTDYRTWRQLIAEPPQGYRFFAVSLRHFYPERWDGKGDKFSIVQHAADLAAFMEALGVGPVYLVAHSRGASVGLKAALTGACQEL